MLIVRHSLTDTSGFTYLYKWVICGLRVGHAWVTLWTMARASDVDNVDYGSRCNLPKDLYISSYLYSN